MEKEFDRRTVAFEYALQMTGGILQNPHEVLANAERVLQFLKGGSDA